MMIRLLTATVILLPVARASAEDPAPEDLQFFENQIRPVLAEHCYQCHSADADEVAAGLLLDSRQGMLTGGESGPVIAPGEPQKSLIIHALEFDGIEMPPEERLPEVVVNNFREWIRRGAPDPRVHTAGSPAAEAASDSRESSHWAFLPPVSAAVPDVQNRSWSRTEADRFVLSKMESAGLLPAPDAKPSVLVRRMFIDLIGLPPTFRETESFVADWEADNDRAVATLADDLLSRPQFGERWGRHWLDVARYGESNGNDGLGRNPTFPHAWRYRDYVIDAMNDDMPFDRFLREQIAGDLLPAKTDKDRDRQLIATGFLALAAKPAKAMNNDFAMDVVADQIDVLGRGIMGISVACARCHDHKFDPIPTREYYALAGIFTSTETLWGTAAHEKLTAPPTDLHVLTTAPLNPPPEGFEETVLVIESATGISKPIPKSKWPVGTPLAMGVRDIEKPADCCINIKGDSKKKGDAVPRGFLTALQFASDRQISINPDGSGRRELAEWITQPDHPLTSRVIVNRVWQHLFGRGIVGSPDDFGVYGDRPTHPELLDYLAVRFVDQGWSLRKLIRSVVVSRTYRQSSRAAALSVEEDPENRLLTRHLRRRLDAESLRDSMLQAGGNLKTARKPGSLVQHRDILINLAGNLHQPDDYRSVYQCYLRGSPPPDLAAFNLPDFTSVTGQRDTSTLPDQALHLFNNPFVVRQSQRVAELVTAQADTTEARIRLMWRQCLGREPAAEEMKDAERLLREFGEPDGDQSAAWNALSQGLLLTNEFRYVD